MLIDYCIDLNDAYDKLNPMIEEIEKLQKDLEDIKRYREAEREKLQSTINWYRTGGREAEISRLNKENEKQRTKIIKLNKKITNQNIRIGKILRESETEKIQIDNSSLFEPENDLE